MLKSLASAMLTVVVYAVASGFVAAADPPAASASPLLKVTYGEVYDSSPPMYSYSVSPEGDIRYEPSSNENNSAKTREPRTLHIAPEAAVGAVNALLAAGFLALQPEVSGRSATRKDGSISLEHIIPMHSQKVTLEFHFEN